MIWTPLRTARLRKLARQKLSAVEIARVMRLTKGQVSGKAWRLGLTLKGKRGRPLKEAA